jgi:hypothetical protein
VIGYEPDDDPEVEYADELRELLEPARETMIHSLPGVSRRCQRAVCDLGAPCQPFIGDLSRPEAARCFWRQMPVVGRRVRHHTGT